MTSKTSFLSPRRLLPAFTAAAVCAGVTLGGGATLASATEVAISVPGAAISASTQPSGITFAGELHGASPSTNGAQPPAAGNNGEMTTRAGYQWFPGRVDGASGVRIRASVPYGKILGHLPRYGHVWLWCKVRASNGSWWYRIAYNTGRGWIYGYSSQHYLYPSPDRAIPGC